jgi:hypothetical protein
MYSSLKKNITLASANTLLFLTAAVKAGFAADPSEVQINEVDLGFKIPNFSDLLSFLVRFFFVMAGLAALFYMLWGAFSWVISGGESGVAGGFFFGESPVGYSVAGSVPDGSFEY